MNKMFGFSTAQRVKVEFAVRVKHRQKTGGWVYKMLVALDRFLGNGQGGLEFVQGFSFSWLLLYQEIHNRIHLF